MLTVQPIQYLQRRRLQAKHANNTSAEKIFEEKKKRKSWLEFQIINFLNAIKYTVRLQLCSDTRQSVDRADGGVMLDFVAGRVD